MSNAIRSVVIPVSDLDASKAIYTAAYGTPHTDESYYVGYNVDGFEIGLNPANDTDGPWSTSTSTTSTPPERRCSTPAPSRSPPLEVAPEARICVLADKDGNPIGLRGR